MNTSKEEISKLVPVTAAPWTMNPDAPEFRRPTQNALAPVLRPPVTPTVFVPVVRPPMIPYTLAPVGRPAMIPYPYTFDSVVRPPITRNSIAPVSRPPHILNPDARQFLPAPYDDRRSLFITFSNGFPLTESQIYHFFDWWYPSYVEHVHVHKPKARGKPSLFGKVTFRHADIPNLVLGHKDKVYHCINGYPFACKKFVSKKITRTGESSDMRR